MSDPDVSTKLEIFFTSYSKHQYKKGEILIRADEESSGVFYVKEGVVRQYAISKKGEELVVNIFKPIAFFPMGWAINNSKNDYYYEALTNLEVYKAPREKLINFLKNNPDVLYDLLSRIYRGLDGLFTRMTYMMSGGAYDRLITEIIIQAKRFGKHKSAPASGTNAERNVIEMHVTERELAAQAGITRETVSREMKILKEKGLVTFAKNVLLIHDLQKLEGELSSF